MNRWTQGFVLLYFMVQLAFQTFLSPLVSEQTKWSMYWIFVGMAVVLIVDGLVTKLQKLRKSEGVTS